MEFRLTYQGPLKGSGRDVRHKQTVRRALHPQLKALWDLAPLRDLLDRVPDQNAPPPWDYIREGHDVGPFRFIPLITSRLHLIAQLDIVLLRPGPPGAIVTQGGDVDNRLKTLFDALRMPKANELPPGDQPK